LQDKANVGLFKIPRDRAINAENGVRGAFSHPTKFFTKKPFNGKYQTGDYPQQEVTS